MSKDIKDLHPLVAKKAQEFLDACKVRGLNVIITSTYRSIEEQNALYAQGRTKSGNVVTNAKGGDSYHNWKVALDFAPVVNGVIPWNDKALFMKIGEVGEKCGFEWGGRWTTFLDLPHLQMTLGYTLNDFKTGKVDLSRFKIPNPVPQAIDTVMQYHKQLTSQLANKDYKGARDTTSYLFTELSKLK